MGLYLRPFVHIFIVNIEVSVFYGIRGLSLNDRTFLFTPSDLIGQDSLSRIRQSLFYDARLWRKGP